MHLKDPLQSREEKSSLPVSVSLAPNNERPLSFGKKERNAELWIKEPFAAKVTIVIATQVLFPQSHCVYNAACIQSKSQLYQRRHRCRFPNTSIIFSNTRKE